MELREYFRILRRRAWIPILLVVVSGLSAGTLVFLSKPEYTATATVMAKAPSGDRTLSFPEIATSNSLALRVLGNLKLHATIDQLTSRINVSSAGRNLFKVSVTDTNPERATELANVVGKEAAALFQELAVGTHQTSFELEKDRARYREQYLSAAKALVQFNLQQPDNANPRDVNVGAQVLLLRLEERAAADAYLNFQQSLNRTRADEASGVPDVAARVVDEAVAKADTRPRLRKIGYAMSLALIVGIGVIILVEYLDDSVREREAVEELVGAPVIGVIPRATARTLRPVKGAPM